jgi:lambda repressor-like predicted transcriptional regulator
MNNELVEKNHHKDFLTKQWLFHLKNAGFSFSKIAHRSQLSPSAIEKLLRHPERSPHRNTVDKIGVFFLKVFGEPPHKTVLTYISEHEMAILYLLNITKQYFLN